MNNRDKVQDLLREGFLIEYKKISLCNLRNYFSERAGQYQVHSENPRCKYSHLYRSEKDALDKFFELKKEADKRR